MARRIFVKFRLDKNGVRRATYFGVALRWLPISVEEAEHKLANDPRYVDVDIAQIELRQLALLKKESSK